MSISRISCARNTHSCINELKEFFRQRGYSLRKATLYKDYSNYDDERDIQLGINYHLFIVAESSTGFKSLKYLRERTFFPEGGFDWLVQSSTGYLDLLPAFEDNVSIERNFPKNDMFGPINLLSREEWVTLGH
jgi:hypothetical protein